MIVPCWGDGRLVRAIAGRALGLHELVVVMVEDDAAGADALREVGARVVVAGAPNRGRQLAMGAEMARGDVLLFHHADSEIAAGQVAAVARAMSDAGVVGGAFHRKFDGRHPLFRWVEPLERWRAPRFGALFGDQSLFVRRAHYAVIGGFRDLALMEDVDFSRRLRRSGRIVLLDPPMTTSDRAHRAGGAWRTSLRNGLFLFLYHLGVSPTRLHGWYYPPPKPS
jgi:hypothetical protein